SIMPRGTIITSSRYPSTGMKSGTLAYHSTRGSRAARYRISTSRLTVRAHCHNRLSAQHQGNAIVSLAVTEQLVTVDRLHCLPALTMLHRLLQRLSPFQQ